MNTHKFDDSDHEDYDQYSSSESCSNIAISTPKTISKNNNGKAISSTAKRNKREQNIQQKFEELSSVVPGSNKEDEDLMLVDTINYLKQLQERAYILEEQKKNKIISLKKAWVYGNNNIGESSSSCVYRSQNALPEVEAKAIGKDVLIRVHCENQEGYLAKMLGEIEKLDLNVENISSMPFGDYFFDITLTAQMSDEFSMTMKDLRSKLTEALQRFM